MAAYVIADVKVTDIEKYKGYQALSPGAVAAAGGEFIVRGGRTEILEGSPDLGRVVVLRFETMDAARAFYSSANYVAARAARAGATERFNMFIVEGI
jgi:uncharacterized protein (DUF1330 family)